MRDFKLKKSMTNIIRHFKYKDDHEYIEEKLSLSIELIEEAMEKAFNDIKGKEEEYQ